MPTISGMLLSHSIPSPTFMSVTWCHIHVPYRHSPLAACTSCCSPAMATSFSQLFAILSPPPGLVPSPRLFLLYRACLRQAQQWKITKTKYLVGVDKIWMSNKLCELIKCGQHNLKKEEEDKSCIRETLNLLMCADRSTNIYIFFLSCVTCQVSHVGRHLSPVTCHMSLEQKSRARDPHIAKSLNMHSRRQ